MISKSMSKFLRNLPDSDPTTKCIKEYSGMIISLAKKHFRKGLDMDDLVSEGITGLLSAIKSFDSARNKEFKNHAYIKIKDAIYIAALAKESQTGIPIYLLKVIVQLRKMQNILSSYGVPTDFINTYVSIDWKTTDLIITASAYKVAFNLSTEELVYLSESLNRVDCSNLIVIRDFISNAAKRYKTTYNILVGKALAYSAQEQMLEEAIGQGVVEGFDEMDFNILSEKFDNNLEMANYFATNCNEAACKFAEACSRDKDQIKRCMDEEKHSKGT